MQRGSDVDSKDNNDPDYNGKVDNENDDNTDTEDSNDAEENDDSDDNVDDWHPGKGGADEEVWPAGEQDVQQADGPAMEDAAAHMKQEPVLEGIDNNIKTNEPLQNTGVELVENVEVETINEENETIDEDNEINDNVTENSAHGRYKLWGNCKPHYDHLKMQLASTWVDTLTISATTESLATPKCQGNRVFNILARQGVL